MGPAPTRSRHTRKTIFRERQYVSTGLVEQTKPPSITQTLSDSTTIEKNIAELRINDNNLSMDRPRPEARTRPGHVAARVEQRVPPSYSNEEFGRRITSDRESVRQNPKLPISQLINKFSLEFIIKT